MDQASGLRMMKEKESGSSLKENAWQEIQRKELKKQAIRVIAVTSGKGGVGKTNIVANLACLLSRMKKKVLVLDGDTGLANIDVIFGLSPKFNLSHVLREECSLWETMVEGPEGVLILPASSGIQELSNLNREQKLMILEELSYLEMELDYLLIDTAAGIAENVMYFNLAAQEIIVVASPEPTSLTDAYALIKVLYQRQGKKKFRLIANMVKNASEGLAIYNRLSQATEHFLHLNVEYLGYIVKDENLPEAVKRQKAVAEVYPHTPAVKCMDRIARKISREKPDGSLNGSVSFFWKQTVG